MPWIKVYTELLDDPKIGTLSRSARLRFVELLLLAGEFDQSGTIPLDIPALSWRLRDGAEAVAADVSALAEVGVIEVDTRGVTVVNFDRRQGRDGEQRAQDADRQRRSRAVRGERPAANDDGDTPEVSRVTANDVTDMSRVTVTDVTDVSRVTNNGVTDVSHVTGVTVTPLDKTRQEQDKDLFAIEVQTTTAPATYDTVAAPKLRALGVRDWTINSLRRDLERVPIEHVVARVKAFEVTPTMRNPGAVLVSNLQELRAIGIGRVR